MTIAVANSRGWIDYEAPVAAYWPEFAQNGKGAVTVRQLLSHEAGLVWIDEPLRPEDMRDLDHVSRALARQKPAWEPGTRHGYHAMTIGLYMQELIRHVDPGQRTLGWFFAEEIAKPLEIEFYIGLPPEIPDERLAQLRLFSPMRAIEALPLVPRGYVMRILWPWSLLRKSMLFADLDPNDRRSLEIEIPAGNGVGTARAIARAYSAFAEGGAELGITPATLASLTPVNDPERPREEVMGVPSCMSLGFLRPGPQLDWGSSRRAFGTPGAGGSFGFADPDAELGFAHVKSAAATHGRYGTRGSRPRRSRCACPSARSQEARGLRCGCRFPSRCLWPRRGAARGVRRGSSSRVPLFSQDKKVAALKSAPLFADLSRKELTELAKVTDVVDFDTGKVLCREGQTGQEFFVIMEGEVEVTRRGKKLATGGSGEFFGEIALVEKLPRAATVTAQTPIRAFVLTRRSFLRLLDEQPRVERKVMRRLARRLVEVSDELSL